jgi:hypothetical protein
MNDYWTKYYKDLEGATILKFMGMNIDDDSGDGFPTYQVKFASGEVGEIAISQDPEGNGGGFIFGLAYPEPVKVSI